jgi:hypothetical protein
LEHAASETEISQKLNQFSSSRFLESQHTVCECVRNYARDVCARATNSRRRSRENKLNQHRLMLINYTFRHTKVKSETAGFPSKTQWAPKNKTNKREKLTCRGIQSEEGRGRRRRRRRVLEASRLGHHALQGPATSQVVLNQLEPQIDVGRGVPHFGGGGEGDGTAPRAHPQGVSRPQWPQIFHRVENVGARSTQHFCCWSLHVEISNAKKMLSAAASVESADCRASAHAACSQYSPPSFSDSAARAASI